MPYKFDEHNAQPDSFQNMDKIDLEISPDKRPLDKQFNP